jgi:beta-galactosidase
MQAIDFNTGWAYRHLDADEDWAAVTIPHDAMLSEPRHALAASGLNSGWFEGRDYEYVKHFTPGRELAGKRMLLEFEGVQHNAEVWVNGRKEAFRPYGYTNFYVDLTNLVNIGEDNEIRVIARNSDQPNSRWYSGAGIYRPVTLWTASAEHIAVNGLFVRTIAVDPKTDDAHISVEVETSDAGNVQIEIADMTGKTVAGLVQSCEAGVNRYEITIADARLWSPEQPELYVCKAVYTAHNGNHDAAESTFGIRTLEWGSKGLLINGSRVIIQGACIHHDNGVLGACAYADAEERKIRLMKENGYNAIRSAHNPCSKALLDACDRLGVLVMDEYIDHWYIHKTQHDYVDYFNEWWRQDLADMVMKDRNHPSVILYSTGNEVSETAQKRGIALTREMTEHLHSLDDTRPVTCGVNIFFNFLSSIGFGQYSDKKAAKEAEAAERKRAAGQTADKHKAVGSEFFNNMAGILGADFMKTGAALPFCDWVTKDAFAAMDVAGYNYGIKRYKHDLKKYPNRLILGSETFCNDAYRFRELAKREPRLIGDFVWAGMDYIGETGVGAWEYEDYASLNIEYGWLTAGSGRVDLTGRSLGEAYYTRVALEQAQGPFIAVCPVNHTGDKHSPSAWKMSNAIDSWSWNGCEGRKANVEVYARAASVALLVNGREVGRKEMKNDCIARFSCTYEPGTLEAVAYGENGREIGRGQLVSATDTTQLTAHVEYQGNELAYVRVRYTDDNGVIKPLERGTLRMERETSAQVLGFGCAAPFNKGSFVTGKTGTYYGEALAVVKVPQSQEGAVTLRISDGKLTAQVSISPNTDSVAKAR